MVTSSSSLALGDEAKLSCSAYYLSIKMSTQIPGGGTFNQGYMICHALKKLGIRLVISCGFNWAIGISLT